MRQTPFVHIFTLLVFLFNTALPIPLAHAEDVLLPKPGVMVHLSPEFNSPILKGIKIHPDNPFRFDFIMDAGDSIDGINDRPSMKEESTKLIKYFLASLTIPEKDLWVNLSPYEGQRIIPDSFGLTQMGRDLLAEDYMLKQITASLIYPEGEIGKKFWKRIYEEAQRKYHTTNIPVATFNKVWIMPEKAVVYENAKAGTAYVVESKLKVMLEEDYLSLSKHTDVRADAAHQLGSQIVREIVIPELTKEVNEGKNFSQLRQVYSSLILATWYKMKITDSILASVYTDKNKVAGVDHNDPQQKERIYHQYIEAFKKGVYNYIKEEMDPVSQERIPRKYFSGGVVFDLARNSTNLKTPLEFISNLPSEASIPTDRAMIINAQVDIMGAQADSGAEFLSREKRLEDFAKFLDYDGKLKDLINHDLISDRGADNTNLENYRREIAQKLADMKQLFGLIATSITVQQGVSAAIGQKINERASKIIKLPESYVYATVKKEYDRLSMGMRPEFLDQVSGRMFGYAAHVNESFLEIADQATSINELLHLIHTYALQNEAILDGIKVWRMINTGQFEGNIIAAGKSTPIAEDIIKELGSVFKILADPSSPEHERYLKLWPGHLPLRVNVLSMPGITYLMVRDYGHALFIEVKGSENEDYLIVNYRIPKAFSKEAVAHLPDITFSSKTSTARGQFKVNPQTAGKEIAEFIRKVPTDTSRWSAENDPMVKETDHAMTGGFDIHIDRFKFNSSDRRGLEIYKELLHMSMDLIQDIKPEELQDILRNISGDKTLKLEDLSKEVTLSYLTEGSHKYVFKVRFSRKDGSNIQILLAAKKEKTPNDISSHELNNLKQLKGRGVPKWGGSFISRDGRRWYLEEFIEGQTLEQMAKEGKLTEDIKKKAISVLLSISGNLGGMVPKDVHMANFILKEGTDEVVMVDIGDKRLFILGKNAYVQHQALFLAILLAQYGARDIPEGNHFIFDTVLSHPFSSKFPDGSLIFRNAAAYASQTTDAQIMDLFLDKGWNMFWTIGASKDNLEPLRNFTHLFRNAMIGYGKDKDISSDSAMQSQEDYSEYLIDRLISPLEGDAQGEFLDLMDQGEKESARRLLLSSSSYSELQKDVRRAVYPGGLDLKIFDLFPNLDTVHFVNVAPFHVDYQTKDLVFEEFDTRLTGARAFKRMKQLYLEDSSQRYLSGQLLDKIVYGSSKSDLKLSSAQIGMDEFIKAELISRGSTQIKITPQEEGVYKIQFLDVFGQKKTIYYHQTDVTKGNYSPSLRSDLEAKNIDLVFFKRLGMSMRQIPQSLWEGLRKNGLLVADDLLMDVGLKKVDSLGGEGTPWENLDELNEKGAMSIYQPGERINADRAMSSEKNQVSKKIIPASIDVGKFIRKELESFKGFAGTKATYELNIPDELVIQNPMIRSSYTKLNDLIDRWQDQLGLVLAEMLKNAFEGRKGIYNSTVTKVGLKAWINEGSQKLMIEISDNGEGIDFPDVKNMRSTKSLADNRGHGHRSYDLIEEALGGEVKIDTRRMEDVGRDKSGTVIQISIPVNQNDQAMTSQALSEDPSAFYANFMAKQEAQYQSQKTTAGYQRAMQLTKHVLSMALTIMGQPQLVGEVLDKIELRLSKGNYPSSTDALFSKKIVVDWVVDGKLKALGAELGHAIHFALRNENPHLAVAEVYDSFVSMMVERSVGSNSQMMSKRDIRLGKYLMDFIKQSSKWNWQNIPTGDDEKIFSEFLEDFKNYILQQMIDSKVPNAQFKATKLLTSAVGDAHYGFNHLVGAYILYELYELNGRDISAAARQLYRALKDRSVDFQSPDRFLKTVIEMDQRTYDELYQASLFKLAWLSWDKYHQQTEGQVAFMMDDFPKSWDAENAELDRIERSTTLVRDFMKEEFNRMNRLVDERANEIVDLPLKFNGGFDLKAFEAQAYKEPLRINSPTFDAQKELMTFQVVESIESTQSVFSGITGPLRQRLIVYLMSEQGKVNKNVIKEISDSLNIPSEMFQQQRVSIQTDNAQRANTGGIDFNTQFMNLQVDNQGHRMSFKLDPAKLQQLQNAPGLTPVILNIQPLQSIPLFLGIKESPEVSSQIS